ncbi:orotidine-5'-phosphate decarboxylase [Desulfitispora alkaliphila]|uniref:orotidine-5'-phosphate decarboxylase n=1 Tax=Desulfitispora alkaliphila TaxID=622674 RepID=UPI003D1BDBFD
MSGKEKIIIALDVEDSQKALSAVEQLGDWVEYYKVGMQLYNSAGPDLIKRLVEKNKNVFLDLKFHDIPNTVAEAGKVMVRLGVQMFNVHVSGGYDMMVKTVTSVKEEAEKLNVPTPLILGVTVLTSINQEQFNKEIGYPGLIADKVRDWAILAERSGLDGVVASAQEAKIIREACSDNFAIVTPGIRPEWSSTDDQKRITTPADAFSNGASHIVVGRPVLKSENKVEAIKKIISEVEGIR